eukprot:SAG11_NODE_2254_length_3625_cov_2.484118_5_plen_30_part_00
MQQQQQQRGGGGGVNIHVFIVVLRKDATA